LFDSEPLTEKLITSQYWFGFLVIGIWILFVICYLVLGIFLMFCALHTDQSDICMLGLSHIPVMTYG